MDDDDSAVQQMMGFSAFSSGDKTRPNKKQKLNSNRSASSKITHASAGNATPLGIRTSSQTTVSQPSMNSANSTLQSQTDMQQQDSSVSHTPHVTTTDTVSDAEANNTTEAIHHSSLALDAAMASTSTTAGVSDPTSSTQDSIPAKSAVYTSSDIRSDPNYWTNTSTTSTTKPQTANRNFSGTSHGTNNRQSHPKNRGAYPENDEIGYTNRHSGYTLTNRELNEYARGKDELQEDGSIVTVYFKPNFLEDPWAEFY